MDTNETVYQIKLVQSETKSIRIHDRRTFKRRSSDKDVRLLDKLQNSHEQRDVAEDVSERSNIKLKVKLRPKLKQVTTCYDVSAVKDIVDSMDEELLALIVMNADPEKFINGLKILLAEQIEKE